MRFDGYFLLSDWLNMPNLHDRAFAFGRWWMREWLFGLGDPQPEPCAPKRRRFLIAFSFATWLYRLVVFFSIALVVYHAFFKALGMALFCVEFGWFIVRPIVREARACWARRSALRWRLQTVRSTVLALLVFGFLVLPWHGGIEAPAVFGPLQAQGLYAPQAGYLAQQPLPARDGQKVKAGEVLAVLVAPDLDFKLKQAQADAALLSWQVEQQPFDERLSQQGPALRKHAEAARQTVDGLVAQIGQLTLRAPFDGTVQTADDGLVPGTWLPRGARLFDVIGASQAAGAATAQVKGEAFVGEDDVAQVQVHDPAVFVAALPEFGTLHCRVEAIDRVNLATLDEPYVASVYGGEIPAELQPTTHQLVPLRATYRVRIDACAGHTVLTRQLAGTAMLGHAHESLAWRALTAMLANLEREAGL
jgi:putative peptide zinc metalloprotease protein